MTPDVTLNANGKRPNMPADTATALRAIENAESLDICQLSKEMSTRAKDVSPFAPEEIDEIIMSVKNVLPEVSDIDLDALRGLIESAGHLPHKDWEKTGQSAEVLNNILLDGKTGEGLSDDFKYMFQRVIHEGNWDAAVKHAQSTNDNGKPWAILVTGVNGIRKTTSVYQPWFQDLLDEALVHPDSEGGEKAQISLESLPTGENSFFRQLDHMIITLINHNFQKLYAMTQNAHDFEGDANVKPATEVIQNYSDYKAAMFSRYRTLSEILGVLLVRQASASNMNIMVETSGRDVAMFHYVDSFFPSDKYNKLALHFTINDLSHAESSVDNRMVQEMREGIKALKSGDVDKIIKANAGGPYGSEVLKGIQKDSDAVWDKIIEGNDEVGGDWFKASIKIEAKKDEDWTANAVLSDGSPGKVFTFVAPRQV
uniref:Uncharacterized protein n=1 Tax=Chaetoceros debilis TaxID=122233 RepID=A0A7S3QDC4_9STRA|eukprot:CAMPEP_0194122546 /NCGR_PEP_ID=MMETSP0150-20130528/51086_1 /TAXON_ID=122233 /ORGANISM="Chaetoceros debilis, Strain MM31A-1" /LENGTH=426 /DNA_ID=CAMNT_0038815453 /DNA_START=27 /DNA_END=1307 /DNA_ORIENTATION=+